MNASQAIEILKENGYKQTKQREMLIQIFESKEKDQYFPVKDILEEFQHEFPGASYNTVYRNLYTLVDLDILESTTLHGEQLFRLHCDTDGHHHHFICTSCGRTKPVEVCAIDQVNQSLPGYEIKNHKFEVYGTCPQCK
ncbi:Fur family transcriptional regulator, zinc uptake regulator [Salinibacillus kushneri]|uniref:Fur family transcriptional regulator, zinc uptake regulator n=1 Tax=Salinibacillus kushneri TaxID=237682 RepID=A0A1I0DMI9_9BACI|nr:Fur family transcriptional regulator [Salinibacillus kushneri]SET33558.1 Fur family transcriptional regulator, zinc uptake regulator [Salinibacillus kushneri]